MCAGGSYRRSERLAPGGRNGACGRLGPGGRPFFISCSSSLGIFHRRGTLTKIKISFLRRKRPSGILF